MIFINIVVYKYMYFVYLRMWLFFSIFEIGTQISIHKTLIQIKKKIPKKKRKQKHKKKRIVFDIKQERMRKTIWKCGEEKTKMQKKKFDSFMKY